MSIRRTALLVVAVAAGAAVLGGCTYSAEPAPGSPSSLVGLTTEGFPAPGPAPVPGQITQAPAPLPAPANEPRPATGPRATEGPQTTENPPRSTGAEAPPPGS